MIDGKPAAIEFGSVCSGIEAASVAFNPLGWEAAWFSEIEKFPCAVLAHHYPATPNHGDMTTLVRRVLAGEVKAPDVLCGGTPCQAFSVAGLRQSLDDARGNLSLTFCEIANAIDHVRAARGEDPCAILWENVPGVLSTRDNAFGCFLGALAGSGCELQPAGGRWPDAGCVFGPTRTVAWRVLDAQYFGLAQRRRRVFVVGSARKGFDPCAVLFERDGMRRDSAPLREARERAARATGAGVAGCLNPVGGHSVPGNSVQDVDQGYLQVVPLTMSSGQANAEVVRDGSPSLTCLHEAPIVAHTLRGEGFDGSEDGSEDGSGRGTPLVTVAVGSKHNSHWNGGPHPPLSQASQQRCRGIGGSNQEIFEQGGAGLVPVAFSCKDHGADAGEIAPTLRAMGHSGSHANAGGQVAVAFAHQAGGTQTTLGYDPGNDTAPTLAKCQTPAVHHAMAVRRLTPRECERLQGFPDDYTLIPWRKRPAEECPDGPRYKALGNSWAVPCVRWIGQRIDAQLNNGSNRAGEAA